MKRRVFAVALLAGLVGTFGCAPVSRPAVRSEAGAPTVPIRDRYAAARLELLAAINRDRHAAGLAPVRLDSLATVVAQGHATAMVTDRFFSHYGLFGEAPYERAARAGVDGHVQENVYRWRLRTLDPAGTGDPWPVFDVPQAHRSLMASSGHRETILDPHRSHVGLGIAADPESGAVYVVEDFLARYAEIDPPPPSWPGARTSLKGRVLDPGLRPLLVRLHREPVDAIGIPTPGPYRDGRGEGRIVPPWAPGWRSGPRSFEIDLRAALGDPGRWYGVLYVAPRRTVERALGRGAVTTEEGWPAAAFLVDVY